MTHHPAACRCAAPLALALVAAACATPRVHVAPIHFTARTTADGHTTVDISTAKSTFAAAGRALSRKRYRRALALYDRVVTQYAGSMYTLAALYNGGLACEKLGKWPAAARRYQRVLDQFFSERDAVDAGFRLAAAQAETRDYAASARTLAKLLTHRKLHDDERIEALARRGLALFRLGDSRKARRAFKRALAVHAAMKERLDGDFYLAMAHYYLAAIYHVTFRKLPLVAGDKMGQQLEAKSRVLFSAQRAYLSAIAVRNSHWASAAGFQLGSLYEELYRSLMSALPRFSKLAKKHAAREKLTVEQTRRELARVYLEELHKRIKPLLHKSIRVFERNVLMAERVGLHGAWVRKSRYQLRRLRELLAATPEKAIQMLPAKGTMPEDERPPPASRPATKPPEPTRAIM